MSIKDVRFGFDFLTDTNIKCCMDCLDDWELTFACLPISSLSLKTGDYKPSDTILNSEFSQKWCHCVVAKVSQPVDISNENKLTSEIKKAFVQDISWAAFLNVFSIMFELPLDIDLVHVVRLLDNQIDAYLDSAMSLQFWIKVPVVSPLIQDTWHKWTKFMSLTRNTDRIKLALEIGLELPDSNTLFRWLGEPVTALIVNAQSFLTNKKGFPVLSRQHQDFVKKMFNIGTQIVVSGPSSVRQHFNYLAHLYENTAPITPYGSLDYISGYEDFLQTPLQPLENNLQSTVYETFEQDPVKYREYSRAIGMALADKVTNQVIGKESNSIRKVVVYVLGAGRGPLVDATLEASDNKGISVRVIALEKNENALPTLYTKLTTDRWRDRVTVECADMRYWDPPEKCDIMVSELLGSFGDNELSPECLDGAQRYLKDDGISIPCSYTSYISPVQSRKLHTEIMSIKHKESGCNFQRPYVVQLNNVYPIATAKPLFTFNHPRKSKNGNNNRDGSVMFDVHQDCILHGLAGYFETVLYKEVRLSIVPETFSNGMFSWFPAYFPLVNPVILSKDEQLQVNFWRFSDKHKVWYEWCISKPCQTVIHNVNGTTYSMIL
ncbi:protein arginine N-methyltransferase 5-like [Daktulosphaira vitifoliae]|uniref:protein arginine N-methyltransferase 5-like n=1 Tax=Daktulosphaira vitifoliae TaxID=58002 RepID=UPI0021A9DBCF|nr:protein arginine N-methyltransferase 5-like [Daktulosphaira vitifoliae]